MKKNIFTKKIILPAFLIIIFFLAVLVIVKQNKKKTEPILSPEETEENQEKKKEESTEKLILKAKKTNTGIAITAKPTFSPIKLRAFAINAHIEINKPLGKITNKNIAIGKDLSGSSWIFPIKELKVNDQNIEIKLSGFVTGNPTSLEKDIQILLIDLPNEEIKDININLFNADNEVTIFLNNTAEKISYQIITEGD